MTEHDDLIPKAEKLKPAQLEFAKNLKFACGYFRSVADVCRRLDINRAQFNRYLNGSTTPSTFILQQICDFFGVEPSEMYLPHAQFAKILEIPEDKKPGGAALMQHIQHLQQLSTGKFDKYLGYYYEYYNSMSLIGRVVRGLIHLFKDADGSYYYERFERVPPRANAGESYRFKYLGGAFYLHDRIFLVDYETTNHSEISQTVLFPAYKRKVQRLNGLILGVSSGNQRPIACARIVLDYLGERIDIRKAARECGILDAKESHIDPTILRVIDNSVHINPHHFCTLSD